MHAHTQEMLDALEESRARLRETVALVPADRVRTRPAPEKWSVAEILEHLATVETRVATLVQQKLAGARADGLGASGPATRSIRGMVDETLFVDRSRRFTAPNAIHPTGALDADAAWTALAASRAKLREVVMATDGLELGGVVHPHPIFGPFNLYQWILFVGGHEVRHTDQIREVLDALASG